MKKIVSIAIVFAVLIYIGGAFDSSGNFRGTKAMLSKTLETAMWLPEKAESFLSKYTNIDFTIKPPQSLPDDQVTKLDPDFTLPYIVDDKSYILYLKFVSYVDGSTGFFDGLADILLDRWISKNRVTSDIFTFTIIGNSYNDLWVGSQIEIKAGAHSALPRYHKIKGDTLLFPDGKTYKINNEVELPYEWLFLPSSISEQKD